MSRPIRSTPPGQRRQTRIRDWREHAGLSMPQLCKALEAQGFHVTDGHLSRVERGVTGYSQELLEALASHYQITPGDLLDGEPGARYEERPPELTLWASLDFDERSKAVQMLRLMFPTKFPPTF